MDGDAYLPSWAGLTSRGRLLWSGAFAVAYVLGAVAAKALDIPGAYAPWYPPAGILLAYLLVVGPRLVPVALALALAVRIGSELILFPDLVDEQGIGAILLRSIVVVVVYAGAAFVLRRNRVDHARLPQFGWFVGVGVVLAPLLATTGVALLDIALLDVSTEDAYDAARRFWVGDAVAIASIVPFILLCAVARRGGLDRPHLPVSLTDRVEIAGQAAALVLVPIALFALESNRSIAPFLFVAILPVIWVALRQDLVVASAGILVTNTVVVVAARVRVDSGSEADLVQIQAVMLAAALAALYAGAVRRTASIHLADVSLREQQLRSLLTWSPALIARFSTDGTPLLVPDRPPSPGAVDDRHVVTALEQSWPALSPGMTTRTVIDHEWEIDGPDGTHSLHTRAVVEPGIGGSNPNVLTVTSDRTELRRAQREAADRRRIDAVTGLPNRSALVERLDSSAVPAVVSMLIDRVDITMAGLSSSDGDRVMVELTARLTAVVGTDHYLARTATHGFSIVPARTDQARELAEAAIAAIAAPLRWGDEELYLTASAGFAVPGRLDDAETATRLAQDAGGQRTMGFEPGMAVEANRLREQITGLRRAIDRHELVVHYQPIIDLDDGSLVGVEALARWDRPGHGLIQPDDFIPLAERAGLVTDIGADVLAQVTRDLTALVHDRSARLSVSVNVSTGELGDESWPDRILVAGRELGRAGIVLEVELTETAVMDDPEQACVVLEKVRAGGVRVVLDDFGTGFSTISWLHRLPVDALKIDRSFVANLPEDADCTRIVGATVSLAGQLGLSTTAEGVETTGQRDVLSTMGCQRGQGYLFDRPMTLADLQLKLTRSTGSA